jgi:ATP-dependent Zn protease
VICHEAGHAAVQEILAPGSVCFAYAFGKKASDFDGFVKTVYPESVINRAHWNQFEVLTALAGRAAVDLIYGRVDCGSTLDLTYARDLLDSTIRNDSEYSLLFPRDTGDLSQDSKALTEKLAMSEMLRAYQQVKALLAANREFLCKIAEALAYCKDANEKNAAADDSAAKASAYDAIMRAYQQNSAAAAINAAIG